MDFCKSCGAIIDDNALFCPSCGQPVFDLAGTNNTSSGKLTPLMDSSYTFTRNRDEQKEEGGE